ncbi:MAG: hypothetical protein MJA84_17765, partial [Firmicutes bacterium]|nr:hypothetical protein [Bacillota bacterium]
MNPVISKSSSMVGFQPAHAKKKNKDQVTSQNQKNSSDLLDLMHKSSVVNNALTFKGKKSNIGFKGGGDDVKKYLDPDYEEKRIKELRSGQGWFDWHVWGKKEDARLTATYEKRVGLQIAGDYLKKTE